MFGSEGLSERIVTKAPAILPVRLVGTLLTILKENVLELLDGMLIVLVLGYGPQKLIHPSELTGLPERTTAKRLIIIVAGPSFSTVTVTSREVPAVTVIGQLLY